ncbi:MAG TPA: 50S ribosomal protein L7ae [Clostridiales bacterium]|nr:50S ribosomal protein L7ae [Clostridiales bacterium]
MDNDRVLGFLGLAAKAGKLVSGEEMCLRMIHKGKVRCIIMAEDASSNARQRLSKACSAAGIRCLTYGNKASLGRHIGKEIRAVVGVMDGNFSKRLMELVTGVE